jgi:hypothetical protein
VVGCIGVVCEKILALHGPIIQYRAERGNLYSFGKPEEPCRLKNLFNTLETAV